MTWLLERLLDQLALLVGRLITIRALVGYIDVPKLHTTARHP